MNNPAPVVPRSANREPCVTARPTERPLRVLLDSHARTPSGDATERSRVRSIAIVGNAPLEPDPRRAAVIDGCDLVVRMTTFGLDGPGAEPAVGRRCDVVVLHRFVRPSPYTFMDYTSRLYLLFEQGRPFGETSGLPAWWPADLGIVPVSNREFTAPLGELLGLPAGERTWATAGTLSAYLMTELFPEAVTHLAGISVIDDPDQTSFRHHWGEAVPVTPEHRLAAEARLLRRWITDERVRFLP